MCRWVEVISASIAGGATNTDELGELLGCAPDQLVPLSGPPLEPQQCLCNLDFEATAVKFGFTHQYDEMGCDQFVAKDMDLSLLEGPAQ
ncbi:hypothetical protein [Geopseudomonas aromaticivorans]